MRFKTPHDQADKKNTSFTQLGFLSIIEQNLNRSSKEAYLQMSCSSSLLTPIGNSIPD